MLNEMRTIETKAIVSADGKVTVQWPPGLPPGEHKVTIIIEDIPPRTFSDLANHWGKPFIEGLAKKRIVNGFPDGTFRPDPTMSRAQFAAVVGTAFSLPRKREKITFKDVPVGYWAVPGIEKAYEMGFISGFPGEEFRPNEPVTAVQIILSLVNGLGIQAAGAEDVQLWQVYQDWTEIPDYAKKQVAIATLKGLVVDGQGQQNLKPNSPATRAEVVAFIYQALTLAGGVPTINSDLIVTYPPKKPLPQTVKLQHRREFRGVWVAGIWNINWPSQRGLSSNEQKQELITILDRLDSLNLNALILQIRPEGDAFYASQLEPWSAWLTGTQGKAPNPYYDPLEFAVAEGHKRGIEIHAWFNPYRAKTSSQTSPNVKPHLDAVYPSAVYQYGTQRWMDPGLKVVQDRTYNVIIDVVQRYDVDGIHLDDYFYPYPISGKPFPDDNSYNTYKGKGGNLSRDDWRRDNVNQMVKRLGEGIHAAKPHIRFGISPFGIYRPGQPPGISGLDQFGDLYADPKKWLAEGWVDYIAPQLYWSIAQRQQSYPVLLKWWTENNPRGKDIYVGNNLAKLEGNAWSVTEIEQQIKLTRDFFLQKATGNIYYNMKPFARNLQGVNDRFQTAIYAQPTLVPVLPDTKLTPPEIPTGVKVEDGRVSWNRGTQNLKGWTLYQQVSGNWKLEQTLPLQITEIKLNSGTYAVCAVNRVSQESAGVVFTI
ncbi:MAG: family 10 glycosylhydrolase [Spirulinaceae cyanobacterium]